NVPVTQLLPSNHVPEVNRACRVRIIRSIWSQLEVPVRRDREHVPFRGEGQGGDVLLVVLVKAMDLFAGGGVPQTCCATVAARGERLAVRRKSDTQGTLRSCFKSANDFPTGNIPNANRPVATGGGEPFAVRGEGDAIDPIEAAQLSPRRRLPQPYHI